MKKTSILFLFFMTMFLSFDALASWSVFKDHKSSSGSAQYACDSHIANGTSNGKIVACKTGYSTAIGHHSIEYTWSGGGIPDSLPAGLTYYGGEYSDEVCQSQYGGSETRVITGIPQTFVGETAAAGACSITPQTGSSCWVSDGVNKCLGTFEATSSGDTNQPGESQPTSATVTDPAEEVPDYLTPTEQCSAYNCVTIDGQLYQVDQDAIPSDGSVNFSQESDVIEFFPDGGYKLVHPDGSYEEMDASGTVTYHNPDGSVDPDGGTDSGSGSGSGGGDSGSPTDAGDIDFSDSTSGGGTTPGTSTDEEGNPEGMGAGDGDSTLGDVVGSITNLRNSLTGTLQEGFQGVVDKLTSTEGMPTEADATAMVNGEGAADDVMANLESQYEETNVALVDDYEGVFKDDGGILGQALSEVGDMATSLLPSIPTGGCSPLVFGDGEATFTIPCKVFDMIKAALSWILFFFTVYEVTSIGLGYRNNA